jgi:hypothetical protein
MSLRTSSVSESFPSSTRRSTAAATNGFVKDPASKIVFELIGTSLEVGRAVSAVRDELSVMRDGDRASGSGWRGPTEDLVDLAGLVLRVSRRADKQGGDHERY